MSEWRDIESAPKDGKPFIGWERRRKQPTLYRWSERSISFAPIHAEIELELTGASGGYFQPTHWMPLPAPPSSPASA